MKKIMAVILAIVMLAAVGVTASAASRPDVNPRIYVDEDNVIHLESADDFFYWFGIDHQIELFKGALKEFVLEDEEIFEALKEEYDVDNIDALIEAMWADGGLEVFCEGLSEDLGMEVTPDNYRSEAVLREIYILGINAITHGEADIPEDASYDDVVAYVEYLFEEDETSTTTTTAASETTTGVDNTTTTAVDESTTGADTTTTTVQESTTNVDNTTTTVVDESTTGADVTTTTAPVTTTKKAGESSSPETGDPSMAMTAAFALIGALGVVATGKRKK